MKYVKYQEPIPHPSGRGHTETIVVKLSIETAIERQKKAAAARGFIYPSDEAALDDFLVIHWGELSD